MPALSNAPSLCAPSGGTAGSGPIALPPLVGAQPGASPQTSGAQTTDAFMQLFAGMVNATTGNVATTVPTAQDLAAFGLDCGIELTSESTDTDSDDTDSDTDEADGLALAALLPGIVSVPISSHGAAPRGGDGTSIDVAALAKASIPVDVSDASVEALLDDIADAASSAPAATTDASSADAQNAANTTSHIHALLNSHAAAGADASPDALVQSPVGSPAWKDEIGAHLTWMAVNGKEAASLRLSPEHLGPLEISISVDDGKASVYFGAASADTRAALEQSLPRLRELFASQGMVLADAGVSRDAPRNQFKPASTPGGSRSSSDAGDEAAVKSVTLARAGLIDTYV